VEELLPHHEGGLADVLLAALQTRKVSAGDAPLALGQELQRIQAGPQVLLRPVAQANECLQQRQSSPLLKFCARGCRN
jgi:hypothetical protein